MPGAEQLWDMTQAAVAALFAAVSDDGDRGAFFPDTGWFVRNIAKALMMASTDVLRWEGLEEPIETAVDGQPTLWAAPGAPRTPYSWLRALGPSGAVNIGTYQEDALFGLRFDPGPTPGVPPAAALGWLRQRSDIPLVRGAIRRVDLVFDTQAEGLSDQGVFTEVLLRSERESTLLMAADAYYLDEWHLCDDAVVAVPDLTTADALQWTLGRPNWRLPHLRTD